MKWISLAVDAAVAGSVYWAVSTLTMSWALAVVAVLVVMAYGVWNFSQGLERSLVRDKRVLLLAKAALERANQRMATLERSTIGPHQVH